MLLKIFNEHRNLGLQIFQLAWADVRRTYRGAALGWAWALIKPATMIAVYWFVIGKGLRAGNTIEGSDYFSWLLAGMLPWFYIRDMLSSGTSAFKKYRYLVTKIKFPVSTIPTLVNISNFMTHLSLMLIIVIIFLLNGNLGETEYLIQLPLYMITCFVFLNLWGMLSGPLAAISKDWSNLVGATTRILFWMSGILYSIDNINTPWARSVLRLNPINYLVEGYRNSLIYNTWFYEDATQLAIFSITMLVFAVLSIGVYSRARNEMADNL